MTTFTAKSYQQDVLNSVKAYFERIHEDGDESITRTTLDSRMVIIVATRHAFQVENKGANRWSAAEEDRKIGKLWAETSKGKCLFVMVKERKWEWIDSLLD